MRLRYFSFLSLGIAAAFLVVASQAFALFDVMNLALGVGIGMLIVSLAVVFRYHEHIPSLVTGAGAAVVSAWMIVASQTFSLATVQTLTFADALGIAGLTLVGLSAHELSTERVVHSLQTSRSGASSAERANGHVLA